MAQNKSRELAKYHNQLLPCNCAYRRKYKYRLGAGAVDTFGLCFLIRNRAAYFGSHLAPSRTWTLMASYEMVANSNEVLV